MQRYLRKNRALDGERGTALAVAMLVIVMLTAVGALALNAASYDMASVGVINESHSANNIAGGAMALGRCETCESIDGILLYMRSVRETRGESASFEMSQAALEGDLEGGNPAFTQPDATIGRGAFGNVLDASKTVHPPQFHLTLDRPRESGREIEGYSIREAAGSDTDSFCFYNLRATADGALVPPSAGPATPGTKARHRAYIIAGPLPCSG